MQSMYMFYTLGKTLQLLKHSPKTSLKDLGKVSFKLGGGGGGSEPGRGGSPVFIYLVIYLFSSSSSSSSSYYYYYYYYHYFCYFFFNWGGPYLFCFQPLEGHTYCGKKKRRLFSLVNMQSLCKNKTSSFKQSYQLRSMQIIGSHQKCH